MSGTDESSGESRGAAGRWVGGRYEILRRLGRGRMGEVYLADDHRGRKQVALKFAKVEPGDDLRHRLVREVGLAHRVSHPNVCRVYDLDTHGDHVFVAMEYVDGATLREVLDRRLGRLTPDERLRIAYGLCDGLAAIHDQHVIHRDLKPSNVLLDSAERPVITDFGLAVHALGAADRSGTRAYMAPELSTGAPPSIQSDLYALGLVLYELFTDRDAVDRDPAEPLHFPSAADVPEPVEAIVLQCLDADPARRPRSAREVARALPEMRLEPDRERGIVSPAALLVAPRPDVDQRALRWAFASFCAVWALVALIGPLAEPTHVLAEPPAVLGKLARDTLDAVGVAPMPYRSWGFRHDHETGAITFWYHQSPVPLAPRQPTDVIYEHFAPRRTAMLSTTLELDPAGDLVRYDRRPWTTGHELATEPDWAPLWAAAGLEPDQLRSVPADWTPPTFADRRAAWVDDTEPEPRLVRAAALAGQPVAFQVAAKNAPDVHSDRFRDSPPELSSLLGRWIFSLWFLVVLAGTLFLAWRHLRHLTSDRPAAWRLAAFVLGARFLVGALGAHHIVGLAEIFVLQAHFAWALHDAALVWLLHVAFEPLARVEHPARAASWARLLYGRWRDPLVGRDLLAGSLAGATIVLWSRLYGTVPGWLGLESPRLDRLGALAWQIHQVGLDIQLEALRGPRQTLAMLVFALVAALIASLFAMSGVLVLDRTVRRPWLSRSLAFGLLVVLFFPDAGDPVLDTIVAMASAGLWLFLLLRLGALTVTTATVCAWWLASHPLTLDPDSWHIEGSILTLLAVAAIGLWGFAVASRAGSSAPERRL